MRTLSNYYSPRNFATELLHEMGLSFDHDNFFSDTPARTYDQRSFDPPTEIAESDDHYLMSFDLPGLKKEEIKIETHQNTLVISGERRRESMANKKHTLQRFEKSYGSFKKSFTLPTAVQSDKIEAHFEDGVLSLYIPKAASSQKKQIEIQSGKPSIFSNLLNKDAGTTKAINEEQK